MPYIGNPPAERFTSFAYQDLTGGSGTSFTLDNAVGNPQEIEVFVNNVRQEPGIAYTVSGTALTMTGSIATTDDFYVVFQGKAIQTATHPSDRALTATDGTFTGNTSVTGNATVTSNLTVDTNTLHVDATNNRVFVGATSGDRKFEVHDTGATPANFKSTGANCLIAFDNSSDTVQNHLIGFSGDDFRVVETTEKIRVLSGGGITFNGDTAAANALDDYEEGTFTPAPTVGTVSLADAAYTKVGRKVTVHFNAYSFSDRSSTSHIEFTNLPYTADSSIGSTANSGMHRYINAGDSLAFYIPRNQSKIQLFSLNSGSGWTPTQYSHLNSASSEMYVHLTYFTAT